MRQRRKAGLVSLRLQDFGHRSLLPVLKRIFRLLQFVFSYVRSRLVQRRQKTGGFRQRFLVFRLGIGIGHDAGTDVEVRQAVFANCRADGDAQLAFAVEAEIANRAAVRSALNWLEFVNDFHRAELGRAGNAATGKT